MKPAILRLLTARLPDGRPGDPGLFGPGSAAWRVNGEVVLIAAGPRALLMQIAHPLVAAGVARHSDFPANAFDRLGRTLGAMLAISFGDSEQARAAAEAVTAVHRRVAGRTESGATYSALNPELLVWVWATLVDSALVAHRSLVGGLSGHDEGRYVMEMRRLALAMRTPARVLPKDPAAFHAYVAGTVAQLEVTDEARRLAPAIVTPPLPIPLRPLGALQRAITVGLLPEPLRRAYGLTWSRPWERAFDAATAVVRTALRATPPVLRRLPQARLSGARAAANRDERGARAGSPRNRKAAGRL